MADSSVKTRIKDLLQDITVDNVAIGQFATDAAKEIKCTPNRNVVES